MRRKIENADFLFMSVAFSGALSVTASVHEFFRQIPVPLSPIELADATGMVFIFGCLIKGFRDLERDVKPPDASIRWATVAGGITGIAMSWNLVAGNTAMFSKFPTPIILEQSINLKPNAPQRPRVAFARSLEVAARADL